MKNLIIALVFFMTNLVLAAAEEEIEISSGKISGITLDSGVRAYLGIPYAAAPVGDLRWKAPEPPIPWRGVKVVDRHGPACIQRRDVYMSEDCLFLDIWTNSQKGKKLPVMVWIHGGGWTFGSNSQDIYDGEAFAENGVVLVSVNYRMNSFGWMAHPELSRESKEGVSGNYGVLDHIAALKWVQENIESFGGDKNNVTIFGESAGGGSIYALLATPQADGLFHKAISESTWIHPNNVTNLKKPNGFQDSAESLGKTAIEKVLGSSDENILTRMRSMSPEEVLGLEHSVALIVDGWLFEQDPIETFLAGKHNNVPIISGYNDGEGLMFVRPANAPSSIQEQRDRRTNQFGDLGEALVSYYVADDPNNIYGKEVDYSSDSVFIRASRELALAGARIGQPDSYLYVFERNPNDPSNRASHFMEVPYVFNNLPAQASTEDKELAKLINDYWVQFAKTGSPNGPDLPAWPAYDLETKRHQVLDVKISQGENDRKDELDLMDIYVRDTYRSAH